MPFVKFWGPVVSKGSLFHEKTTVEMHVRLPLIIELVIGHLLLFPRSIQRHTKRHNEEGLSLYLQSLLINGTYFWGDQSLPLPIASVRY